MWQPTAENDDGFGCSFLHNSGTITVVYEEQSVLVFVMIVMPYMTTNILVVFLYLYLLIEQICNCVIITSA